MIGTGVSSWDRRVDASREKGDCSVVCGREGGEGDCVGARAAGFDFLGTGGGSKYTGPFVRGGISTNVKDVIAGVG
jgi:hypothetical protein